MRTFRPALRGQRGAIVGTFVLSLLVTALELAKPWPIKIVLDSVIGNGGRGGGSGAFGMSPRLTLALAALSVFLISVLLGTLSSASLTSAARVGRKVTTRIRRQVFEHLHRLSLPFHQSSRSGDLLVRLMGDVNTIRDALFASWVGLLTRGLLFVGTVVVMILIDPWLGALALYPLPLLGFQLRRSSRELKEVTRKQRRREGDAASFAAETLRQIRVVKAYGGEDAATERFARDSRSGERAGVRAARIAARMAQTTEILSGLGLALIVYVGGWWALTGRITPGELIVFASYARSLYKPLRGVSKEGARLSKATACAERLMEVLDRPPEDRTVGEPAPRFDGLVELRDARLSYDGGVEALRGLSFRVEPGQLAVVAGPNGSGKTTVLSVLLRLLRPEDGAVLVDGRPVEEFELESYRARIAYVPQDLQLFGATVRENILYGRPDATAEEVEEAGRAALFDEVVAEFPDGYDTVLGEAGSTLSGGQARRLMLARAALRDADLLLLDEPLSGLDPKARPRVAEAIRRIAAGRTTLVVSHGPASELQPDVVLRMAAGRLAGRAETWAGSPA